MSIHQLAHADFMVMYVINIFLVLHFDITHGIQEIFCIVMVIIELA